MLNLNKTNSITLPNISILGTVKESGEIEIQNSSVTFDFTKNILNISENTYFSNHFIMDFSNTKEVDLFKTYFKKVTPGKKLLFKKGINYPRYILSFANLKSCKSIKNADFVVIPDSLLEDSNLLFSGVFFTATTENDNTKKTYFIGDYIFYSTIHKSVPELDVKTIINFINLFCSELKNIEFLLIGKYKRIIKDNIPFLDILSKKYDVSFILVSELDKYVNSNLCTLTEKDARNIISMLNSKDKEIVSLAMKAISGYNIDKTPLTIRTILVINNPIEWVYNKVRKTNSFKRVIKRLSLESFAHNIYKSSPFYYRYLELPNNEEINEFDKNLASTLLTEHIQNITDRMINTLQMTYMADSLDLSINCSVTPK